MREQYEYQRAVDAELASAVKTHGKLITFGVVLHDEDGKVFWLNHNNHQFADELLLLLDQGAVPMAYMGATTGQGIYLTFVSTQLTAVIPAALLERPVTAQVYVETGDGMGDIPLLQTSAVSFDVESTLGGISTTFGPGRQDVCSSPSRPPIVRRVRETKGVT